MRLRIGLALTSVFAAGLAIAAPASALDCAQFKTAVESATNGAVVVLDAGLTCHDSYHLPDTHAPPFNITVGGGEGATLDGTGLLSGQSILFGAPAAGKELGVSIRGLIFRNASSGAIRLAGEDVSAALDGDRFLSDSLGLADGGGAVTIQSSGPVGILHSQFGDGTAGGGNTSGGRGGALAIYAGSITLTGDSFRGNGAFGAAGAADLSADTVSVTDSTFAGNTAHGDGGALAVGATTAQLQGNSFVGNRIVNPSGDQARGGGVIAQGFGKGSLSQIGNRFDRNSIGSSSQPNFDAQGGGEWIIGEDVTSERDRFTRNSLPAPTGTGESEGGGLGIEGCMDLTPRRTKARIAGAVVAGNRGARGVRGAGFYAGSCRHGAVDLTLLDSTIAGNASGGAGGAAGLLGGSDDSLVLRNSVVAGNAGDKNLAGFGKGRAVSHSDACAPGVLPGAGNICAKPRLADAGHGDAHETVFSPTIDRGKDTQVPAGLTTDLDGGTRIVGPAVDMGADELRHSDDPFAKAKLIAEQTVKAPDGLAKIRVRCPKNVPGPCRGAVALRSNGSKVGHHSFSIARGESDRVPVQLNESARGRLSENGHLTVVAAVVATDALGTQRTSSAKVKLKTG